MRVFVIIVLFFLAGCADQQTQQSSNPELRLESGFKKLSVRKRKDAIVDFDKVIALCKWQYVSGEKRTYASRGLTETVYYMAKASADNEAAIAVGPTCADALYMRGYASLDLGQVDLAQELFSALSTWLL